MSRAPALSDDRRLELVAIASGAERANKPTHLILIAALAVAGSLLYLAIAWRSYTAAADSRDQQQHTAAEVVETAARLRAVIAAESQGNGPSLAETGTRIYGRIEQAGVEAGLKDRVPSPISTRSDKVQGTDISRVIRDYDIRDPSLAAIFKWMDTAARDVPGLEVYAVTAKPEAQVWSVRVRFVRHERAEGT